MSRHVERSVLKGKGHGVKHGATALLALFACRPVLCCEPFDFDFEPTGQFVAASTNVKPSANLAVMLNVAYARQASDPNTQSLLVRINSQTNKITIVHHLDNGSNGPSWEYEASCHGDEWRYVQAGKTGAEGVFREYELVVSLKLLSDGRLQVRNDDTIVRGLFFKTTEVSARTAIFNRAL